jgi:hypothetical protein
MLIDLQRYWGDRELYYVGELCSKIIDGMQKDGTVTLYSKESRSAKISGLYFLLDQLIAYHGWNKSDIIIDANNCLESHPEYTVKKDCTKVMLYGATEFFDVLQPSYPVEHRNWNHKKTYGMFLGRANVTRLFGIQQHKKFEYADQGLVSWHHDTRAQLDDKVFVDFLTATGQTYEQMTDTRPFSDIGKIVTPPITGVADGQVDWNSVYEKIGIELIFETSEHEEALTVSEKILRPMLYKRPFMLISGRHAIRNIKQHWASNKFQTINPVSKMRFFENVIPLDYDKDEGIWRVEHVFDILRELIRSGKINTIIDDCQEDLEINYQLIKHLISNRGIYQKAKHLYPFDKNNWKKPTY